MMVSISKKLCQCWSSSGTNCPIMNGSSLARHHMINYPYDPNDKIIILNENRNYILHISKKYGKKIVN